MMSNKVSDLVSAKDGDLSSFFMTQMLTNMQKQVVTLEAINKKMWVLIKKVEQTIPQDGDDVQPGTGEED